MRIRVQQSALSHASDHVAPAVRPDPAQPAAEHVLLEARDGILAVTAISAELVIRAQVPCDVQESGSVVLHAQSLRDLVHNFAPGPVDLSVSSDKAVLTAGTSTAELVGLETALMPERPVVNYTGASIVASQLATLLDRVGFAINGAPGPLGGVLLHMSEGQATAYATDRFRLARSQAQLAPPVTLPDVILPARAVAALTRILGETNGDAAVGVVAPTSGAASRFGVRLNDVEIVASLLEGQFPNCERAIPTPERAVTSITVERAAFLAEIARMLVLANTSNYRIDFELRGANLSWSARQERGVAKGSIPIVVGQGTSLTIGLNGKFLKDMVTRLPSERIEMAYEGPQSPIRLVPEGGDGSLTYVIMPLRAD